VCVDISGGSVRKSVRIATEHLFSIIVTFRVAPILLPITVPVPQLSKEGAWRNK